jgi:gliding motility-associated protein GldM
MAGGKQTPRQRMMGILYLVLLGLIALDVPESLLDAFKNIGDSLNASKTNVQVGIANTFSSFENTKLKEQPERAAPIYARAKKASALAENLNKYIDSLKKIMVGESGGIDPETGDYVGRKQTDISTNLMIEGQRHAFELHKRIDATRTGLLGLLKDKERGGVNLGLQALDPPHRAGFNDKKWEEAKFGDSMPMGAAMTMLIEIQTDVKNAENEVVKKILGEVDQAQVNLDKFNAVAVAPTSFVLLGAPYTAEVFLTAYDSKLKPTITVGGSSLPVDQGKGKYSGSTSTEGLHSWTATLSFKDNDGKVQTFTTPTQTYMVSRPSAVVSPDKMNVLYIGVPNPVSVSAPGIAKENLRVTMTGGTISGSGEHYIATVSSLGSATISVSAETSPGKSAFLGSSPFRVKRIPDPKPQFAALSDGSTPAANIKAQDYVIAKLEGFEFDAKFNVTHFTLLVINPNQFISKNEANGGELTPAMHTALAAVRAGTTIVLKDIVAVGPDGTKRFLASIVLNAN